MMHPNCCYYNTVEDFLKEDKSVWLEVMKQSFLKNHSGLPLGEGQVGAWKDSFNVLKNELPQVNNKYPGLSIIFEYALPYESGRRPDVLLLCKEHVIVLEFKQYSYIDPAHVDQVSAYARDIREYHYESRERKITPVLICTRANSYIMVVLHLQKGNRSGNMVCALNFTDSKNQLLDGLMPQLARRIPLVV